MISCNQSFYDVKLVKHHHTFSFGKGMRFMNKRGSIDCFYDLPSQFSKTKPKRYSFGSNWAAYENVYNEISPNKDKSIPGPGTYTPKYINTSFNFTLKPRLNYGSIISPSSIPGPGKYDVNSTFNKAGQHFISKYISNHKIVFSKESRFKVFDRKLPGPGEYGNSNAINKSGSYFVSKFRSSQVHSFGKLQRNSLYIERCHLETPGPGVYAAPSEFGESAIKQALYAKSRAKTAYMQSREGRSTMQKLPRANELSMEL
jgi:Sperm-tail PG-rich repeat